MDINDLSVYKRSMRLAEKIWAEVDDWPSFAKYSVGTQLTQAADSIAANISEGHGRYHFGENRQFCYYARGSLQETITWLQKVKSRDLITDERYEELSDELVEIRQMLNGYIRSIGNSQDS
ncbi:MAG: four helix bundle protein [Bacteroidetes bacterium SW_8_64_56]|nr:MAG: four helix bundle protein [Bacteroidetes bacterium SW_8_64_56]